jgi:lipopolysaccharide transport system permease protein
VLGFSAFDVRLAANLLSMQLRDRYLGSVLGAFWAIANPLFMLALYTFLFGFVMRVRLPGAETTFAYALWLISGYGPWLGTVEALTASTNSIVGASGIVKNLAIKSELLPMAATFVGALTVGVCLLFVVMLTIADGRGVGAALLWLPVVVAVHFALLVAIGLWLAAANVFVRDLGLALPNLLTIAMFATPIFYPIEALPAILQTITAANPFYILVSAYRSVILEQSMPPVPALLYVVLLATVIFALGLAMFRRVKGQFGSLL